MILPKWSIRMELVKPTQAKIPNKSLPAVEPRAKIVIVGAGLNGLVMAMLLAKQNYKVLVCEKRRQGEDAHPDSRRAMNLTLCERGLSVLDLVHLREQVIAQSVKLDGRVSHKEDGQQIFEAYGSRSNEVLYSIQRTSLSKILSETAACYPNIELRFDTACTLIDKSKKLAQFRNNSQNLVTEEPYDLLIGADGVFSAVRKLMHKDQPSFDHTEVSTWVYKQLTLPESTFVRSDKLHVWARSTSVMFGIPNRDGSITCNLFFNAVEKDTVKNPEEFRRAYPELGAFALDLSIQFNSKPSNHLHTVQTFPWRYEDSIVLVGDACHGVLPFLGQGLNSGLEDCAYLNDMLKASAELWSDGLSKYETIRKRDADALSQLIRNHFVYLNSATFATPVRRLVAMLVKPLVARKRSHIYSMVSHTNISFDEILRKSTTKPGFIFTGLILLLAALLLIGVKII